MSARSAARADIADPAHFVAVARGEEPADLVIVGGRVVNVLSGEIHEADVAVWGGRVVGFGDYVGRTRIEAKGLFVAPGFVDAHIHLESTLLLPREFTRVVVPLGTTAVVADPHEIANVLGIAGVRYMLDASAGLPLDVWFMLPSCVPATDLETSGARLGAAELAGLIDEPRVLGLAEVMNYPGVLARDPAVLAKLGLAVSKQADGHAPGLSGKDLNAYAGVGIGSDHECTTAAEAREKLRAGMQVFLREGSVAKNMAALLPEITPASAPQCGLVSDDRHPNDLLAEGHVDHLLRRAVALGLDPLTAVRLVTINPARHFGLRRVGAVAPGYRADLVLFDDLTAFRARLVMKDGVVVARDGKLTAEVPPPLPCPRASVSIAWPKANPFALVARDRLAKAIEVVPDQIVTRRAVVPVASRDGELVSDPGRDLLKLAVVERHHGTGNVGVGLIRGLGLRAGAIASSVAHDSHNIVVAGENDADMLVAVREIERMGGGLVVAKEGEVAARLALPVAGLMSDRAIDEVAPTVTRLREAARQLGSTLANPFMELSFVALPVVPELRLTDRGLVDVTRFRFVDLFGEG